jgi:hypothetical protein
VSGRRGDMNQGIAPHSHRGRWSADWWLTCGICGSQDFVDGGTRRRPVTQAKEQGWRLTRRNGWVCRECAETR